MGSGRPDERSSNSVGPGKPADRLDELPPADVLEDVVRQTLAGQQPGSVGAEEIEALQQIAKQYGGVPLELQPVAGELVTALLKLRFRSLGLSDEVWQNVGRRVAGTLLDDPVAGDRFRQLWRQLGGASDGQ